MITPGSNIHENPVIRSFSSIDTASLVNSRISNYHKDNNNVNDDYRNNDISDDENTT